MSPVRGEFQCQVCKKKLSVIPEDKTTYLSKTEHDEVFGGRLVTYRVAHVLGDERHVNTIIFDQEGFFRGHREAYAEKIRRKGQPRINHYWTIYREVPALSESKHARLAFIADRRKRWVMELVNPGSVKMRELALIATDRIEEAEKVYETVPGHLTVAIADRELIVWPIDTKLFCVEVMSPEGTELLEKFARSLLNAQQFSAVPSKHLIILALRVIENNPTLLDNPNLLFHF